MEKTIFEQTGGTYYQQDGYLLPCLTAPDGPRVGVWGQRHFQYLRKHRQSIYTALFLTGKLDRYLTKINQQAEEMFLQLVEQMTEQEGVTEQLKECNQIEWIRRINNIKNRVTEIVNAELITI